MAPSSRTKGQRQHNVGPAAVLIALGYLSPVAWLWFVNVNPPARARGEFGGLGLLMDVYWLFWVAMLLCAVGLVVAFMALRQGSAA